ncbi:hypothetical protein [Sphingomonas fennica]|uniref:Uncharacterized protein n=1 Tax=Edaphosphingomonas fennica TaxID=114404 RepID=A0A2T4HQA8_9SPHN|nr:hypothetical protein [Sphingomonas fennica]PTD17993.1 hypothetical protein CV103_15805 [Sphingomonas fennica]
MRTVEPEILSADAALPVLYARRIDPVPERRLYVARPGLRAMPSGSLIMAGCLLLQLWTLTFLLWAMWWPAPQTPRLLAFAVGGTVTLALLVLLVILLLLRRYPGFLLGVARAPFIRLTVTDRRVVWSLPWQRYPLMEIGRERILGGILGAVDRRGFGNAAMIMVHGDPAADIDGNIHFDRLPDVEKFVAALAR